MSIIENAEEDIQIMDAQQLICVEKMLAAMSELAAASGIDFNEDEYRSLFMQEITGDFLFDERQRLQSIINEESAGEYELESVWNHAQLEL